MDDKSWKDLINIWNHNGPTPFLTRFLENLSRWLPSELGRGSSLVSLNLLLPGGRLEKLEHLEEDFEHLVNFEYMLHVEDLEHLVWWAGGEVEIFLPTHLPAMLKPVQV